jgi:stage II sporulation protein R
MGRLNTWTRALILIFPILLVLNSFPFHTSSSSAFANTDQQDDTTLTNGIIPSDAIRLRIIANSDSPEDQQLKRDVRDQIIAAVGKKLHDVTNEQEAESVLKAAVPELDQIAQRVIRQEGFTYTTQTEVGMVPFPTKLYGDQVYPAGNYQALRIVIGQGSGQNWWCVLFPPLCFVDLANGDAVPNKTDFPDATQTKTSDNHAKMNKDGMNSNSHDTAHIQVRFAILDYGKRLVESIAHIISGLFHKLFTN